MAVAGVGVAVVVSRSVAVVACWFGGEARESINSLFQYTWHGEPIFHPPWRNPANNEFSPPLAKTAGTVSFSPPLAKSHGELSFSFSLTKSHGELIFSPPPLIDI